MRILSPPERSISCPFCASTKLLLDARFDDLDEALCYCVLCTACKAHGPLEISKDSAVLRWNIRSSVFANALIEGVGRSQKPKT